METIIGSLHSLHTPDRKVRICHVINQLSGGGAERLVLQLHRYNQNHSLDSYVISLLDREDNVTDGVIGLDAGSPWNPKVLLKLRTLIKSWLEDGNEVILHSHLTQSQLWCSLLVQYFFPTIRLFTTEHDTWNSRRSYRLAKHFDWLLYKPYEQVISISRGVKKSLNTWLPSTVRKSVVIYNGIDLDAFYAEEKKVFKSPLKVISVGRLLPKKNYCTAIEALGLLRNKGYDETRITYEIFGKGELEQELEALISTLGLQEQVILKGYSSCIEEEYKRRDVFLLPSLWEGFGLVVVEAMAGGLVAIVSDIDGVSEVAGKHKESSLLINPKSPEDIASQLETLINDSNLCNQLSENGQKRSKRFCVEKMAKNYLKLYEDNSN